MMSHNMRLGGGGGGGREALWTVRHAKKERGEEKKLLPRKGKQHTVQKWAKTAIVFMADRL